MRIVDCFVFFFLSSRIAFSKCIRIEIMSGELQTTKKQKKENANSSNEVDDVEIGLIESSDWTQFREMSDLQLKEIALKEINGKEMQYVRDSIFELLSMFPFQSKSANNLFLNALKSFSLRLEKLVKKTKS